MSFLFQKWVWLSFCAFLFSAPFTNAQPLVSQQLQTNFFNAYTTTGQPQPMGDTERSQSRSSSTLGKGDQAINHLENGTLEGIALDSNGLPYVNFRLDLFKEDGTWVAYGMTNAEGRVTFDHALEGGFYVRGSWAGAYSNSNVVQNGDGRPMTVQSTAVQAKAQYADGSPMVGLRIYLHHADYGYVHKSQETDANGNVSFEVAPGASYLCYGVVAGAKQFSNVVSAGSGEWMRIQTATIQAKAQYADGSPMVGLRIYLHHAVYGYVHKSRDTDANGNVSFEVAPGESYLCYGTVAGAKQFSNVVSAGSGEWMRIQTATIQAKAQYADGSPMVGLRIYLHHADYGYVHKSQDTDANGNVSFEVPPGESYLCYGTVAGAKQFSNVVSAGSGEWMRIQTATIQAKAQYADGSPMIGFRIYLHHADYGYVHKSQETDANGNVSFEVAPGESYLCYGTIAGAKQFSNIVTAGSGEWMRIQTAIIQANAQYSDGSPMVGLRIYLHHETLGYVHLSAETDVDGMVAFEVPPGQPYLCYGTVAGAKQFSNVVTAGTGELMAIQAVKVQAKAWTASGEQAVGLRFYLSHGDYGYVYIGGETDESGMVNFEVAPGEPYYCYAWIDSEKQFTNTVTAGSGEMMLLNKPLINAQVYHADGSPFPSLQVRLFSGEGEDTGLSAFTDENGEVSFEAEPGRTYTIQAEHSNHIGISEPVVMGDGQSLVLRALSSQAVLTDSEGLPLAGQKIVFLKENGEETGIEAFTNAEGKAWIEAFSGLNLKAQTRLLGTTGSSNVVAIGDGLSMKLETISFGAEVRDSQGNPLSANVAFVTEDDQIVQATRTTDGEGWAGFQILPGEAVHLQAEIEGRLFLGAVETPTKNTKTLFFYDALTQGLISSLVFTNEVDPSNKSYRILTWQAVDESGFSGYRLERRLGEGEWEALSFVAADGNGPYQYRDLQRLDQGKSDYRIILEVEPRTTCVAPTGLTTSDIDQTSARLAWDLVESVSSYQPFYREYGAQSWMSLPETSGNAVILSGLTKGTRYQWYVDVRCSGGETAMSSITDFFTEGSCGAPEGPMVAEVLENSAVLTWRAVPGAYNYQLRWRQGYRTGEVFDWTVVNIPLSGEDLESYELTGLQPNTEYCFELASWCGLEQLSESSSRIPFTTQGQLLLAGFIPDQLDIDPTGAANYSIGIQVPHAPLSLKPELQLSYNSGAGNGLLGMGWQIGGFSAISRCAPTLARDGRPGGIRYNNSDSYCLDGTALVPITGENGGDGTVYRTEQETFQHIVSHASGSAGPDQFTVNGKDGLTRTYDLKVGLADGTADHTWLLTKIEDLHRNKLIFEYTITEGAYRPTRVYAKTNAFESPSEVVFHYEERPDQALSFLRGNPVTVNKRMNRITVLHRGTLVRSYELFYKDHQNGEPSRIDEINLCDQFGGCVTPVQFTWPDNTALFDPNVADQGVDLGALQNEPSHLYHNQGLVKFADFNGDGLVDRYIMRGYALNQGCSVDEIILGGNKGTWDGIGTEITDHVTHFDPRGITKDYRRLQLIRFADFNGDGKADILNLDGWADGEFSSQPGVYINNGLGEFYRVEGGSRRLIHTDEVTERANIEGVQVLDLNGDGREDMIQFFGGNQIEAMVHFADEAGNLVHQPHLDIDHILFKPAPDNNLGIMRKMKLGDFNGDRLLDFISLETKTMYQQSESGWQNLATNIGVADDLPGWSENHASRYRVGDFNGDGLTDIYQFKGGWPDGGSGSDLIHLSKGDGTFHVVQGPETLISSENEDEARLDLARFHIADFNGDGITDLYTVRGRGNSPEDWVYLFNRSAVFERVAGFGTKIHETAADLVEIELAALRFVDLNGDGKLDLYRAVSTDLEETQTHFSLYQTPRIQRFQHQHGKAYSLTYDFLSNDRIYTGHGDEVTQVATAEKVDFNGNPFTWQECFVYNQNLEHIGDRGSHESGLVYSVIQGQWYVLDTSQSRLWKDAGLLGDAYGSGSTSLNVTENLYPLAKIGGPFPVVSKVAFNDGYHDDVVAEYRYADALYHITESRFLGFAEQSTIQLDRNLSTTRRFKLNETQTFGGFEYERERAHGAQILERERFTWSFEETFQGRVFKAMQTEVRKDVWSPDEHQKLRFERLARDFNSHGDVTLQEREILDPEDPLKVYRKQVINQWDTDTLPWPRSLLTQTLSSDSEAEVTQSALATWTYTPEGRIRTERRYVGTPFEVAEHYQYDVHGNRTEVRSEAAGMADRVIRTHMDFEGLFPMGQTNSLGHRLSFVYNKAFGKVIESRDPNGLVTKRTLDSTGSITHTQLPSGAVATSRTFTSGLGPFAGQGPSNALYYVQTINGEGRQTLTWLDAEDRTVRETRWDLHGQKVHQDSRYDKFGRRTGRSEPFLDGETPRWAETIYDDFDRPLEIISIAQPTTRFTYDGYQTTITKAGQSTTKTIDVLGRTVSVKDAHGIVIENEYELTEQSFTKRTLMPQGPAREVTFNQIGLPIRYVDPNSGVLDLGYNAFGERTYRKDDLNRVSTYEYDQVGRQIRKENEDGVSTWNYDTAENGVGFIASVQGPNNYLKSYRYDALSRESETTYQIHGKRYQFQYAYDDYNRMASMTYPGGFVVKHHYNREGNLNKITEGEDVLIWEALDADIRGNINYFRLGNGVETEMTFTDGLSLVQDIQTYSPDGRKIQDLNFGYTALGNLSSRNDFISGSSERFEYDQLNRLLGYELDTPNNSYQVDVDYDLLGNITAKSDVGNYAYNGVGPNAVTSAGSFRYQYDQVGNMIGRERNGTNESFEYNASNRMTLMQAPGRTVRFEYSPGGDRFTKLEENLGEASTTHYAGRFYEHTYDGQGEEKTYFIFAGSRRIGIRKVRNQQAQMRYLHSDHLGSVETITDENGEVVEKLSFDPWGKRRGSEWDPSTTPLTSNETNRGFTDHEMLDAFELVHMNGRIYDPVIGRFTSPDPITQFPDNLQGLNPYTYVLNNPLSLDDPTGHLIGSLVTILTVFNNSTVAGLVVLGSGVVGSVVGGIVADRRGDDVMKGVEKGFGLGVSIAAGIMSIYNKISSMIQNKQQKSEAIQQAIQNREAARLAEIERAAAAERAYLEHLNSMEFIDRVGADTISDFFYWETRSPIAAEHWRRTQLISPIQNKIIESPVVQILPVEDIVVEEPVTFVADDVVQVKPVTVTPSEPTPEIETGWLEAIGNFLRRDFSVLLNMPPNPSSRSKTFTSFSGWFTALDLLLNSNTSNPVWDWESGKLGWQRIFYENSKSLEKSWKNTKWEFKDWWRQVTTTY